MPEHRYATPQGDVLTVWSDAPMSADSALPLPASEAPASVGSLISDLGRKLSMATKDLRVVSVRESSEASDEPLQTGDALDRSLMARIVARDR